MQKIVHNKLRIINCRITINNVIKKEKKWMTACPEKSEKLFMKESEFSFFFISLLFQNILKCLKTTNFFVCFLDLIKISIEIAKANFFLSHDDTRRKKIAMFCIM